jgi:hypothetical protein
VILLLRIDNCQALDDKIQSLAETVPELISQIIDRLESEHGHQLVSRSLSLLACARGGLYEHELLTILGVSSTDWAKLRIGLQVFAPVESNVPHDRLNS